jgi:hypothetical protein
MVRIPPSDLAGRPILARVTRCQWSSKTWDLFFMHVVGGAHQAPPQSRRRYCWAHSETQVRLCCPHLNPLGRGTRFIRSPRSDSGPPPCYAWSRAVHPLRDASDSAVEWGDSHRHFDLPSATAPPTHTPEAVRILVTIRS